MATTKKAKKPMQKKKSSAGATKASLKAKKKSAIPSTASKSAKASSKTASMKKTKIKNKAKGGLKNKKASSKTAAKAKTKASTKNAISSRSTTTQKTKLSSKTASAPSASPKKSGKAWMRPLDDRLLIEIIEEPQVSAGGIILVDSSTQPDNIQGFVVAVGRGHQNKKGRIRPIEAKSGDKVIFSKYAGDKISHDGVNFVVIRESEILGFAPNGN